jgi:spore coat protein CotH
MKLLSFRAIPLASAFLSFSLGCAPGGGGPTNGSGGGGVASGTGGASGGGDLGGSTGASGGAGVGTGGGTATGGGSGATATGGARGAGTGGMGTAGRAGSGGGVGTGGAGTAGQAGTGGAPGAGGAGGGMVGDLSRELYDPAMFPRFDFDLPPASVTALGAVTGPDDPRQDTYVTGTFTYDKSGKNEVVMNVGVRLKGEGSFKPFNEKPAWKIKFDEFVAKQRFRGLARMTFNNAEDDPAFVAERLAYDVYRAAGVPAPRCNSAMIYVNGAFYGVYNNIEAEDKHMIARWFASDAGNLYEKNGMQDFTPAGAADFELETNETANDRSDLTALIAAIGRATTPATFMQDVGSNLDVNEWIKFTAVEGIVNEWDSYSFTLWYPHNFRIYDDPMTKKFAFIPWGNDMAMQPAPARVTNKQFIRMFELTRSQDQPSGRVSSGILFQRCLASAPCKAAYKDAINQVITVWEGLGMEAAAMRYYNQVKAQVYLDTRKVTETGILTNAQFESAFQAVLGVVRGRLATVRADVAAN